MPGGLQDLTTSSQWSGAPAVASLWGQLIVAIACLFASSAFGQSAGQYRILETVDHDPSYFTQGLELFNGEIYESSGLYGKSKLGKYSPVNESVIFEKRLAERFFAEGLTVFGGELFVLTWRENTLLVLNPDDLSIKRELRYGGEGWGLANDGNRLIMSDGSDTIYFRNPGTFKVERTIRVHSQQRAVRRINELEFAEGHIWANIWQSPFIVKIDPANGSVVKYFDFSELVARHMAGNQNQVLNGIAYDRSREAYWITGKLWSKRYLVELE